MCVHAVDKDLGHTCLQGMPSFFSPSVRVTSSFWKSPTSVSSLATWDCTSLPTWDRTSLPIPFKNSGIPTFTARKQKL